MFVPSGLNPIVGPVNLERFCYTIQHWFVFFFKSEWLRNETRRKGRAMFIILWFLDILLGDWFSFVDLILWDEHKYLVRCFHGRIETNDQLSIESQFTSGTVCLSKTQQKRARASKRCSERGWRIDLDLLDSFLAPFCGLYLCNYWKYVDIDNLLRTFQSIYRFFW